MELEWKTRHHTIMTPGSALRTVITRIPHAEQYRCPSGGAIAGTIIVRSMENFVTTLEAPNRLATIPEFADISAGSQSGRSGCVAAWPSRRSPVPRTGAQQAGIEAAKRLATLPRHSAKAQSYEIAPKSAGPPVGGPAPYGFTPGYRVTISRFMGPRTAKSSFFSLTGTSNLSRLFTRSSTSALNCPSVIFMPAWTVFISRPV